MKASQRVDESCGKVVSIENRYAEKCENCSGFEEKIQAKADSSLETENAEMSKHELLCCIASSFGDSPENFAIAEAVFDKIKYKVAEHVLKHEYNRSHSLPVNMSIWLEQRCEPSAVKPLFQIIEKYLHSS